MKEAASNLEFEEAAKIRDEIRKLENSELEIALNPKIKKYDVKNKLYPKGRSTMGMPGTKVTKKEIKNGSTKNNNYWGCHKNWCSDSKEIIRL